MICLLANIHFSKKFLNSQTIYRLFAYVQAETDVYSRKQLVGSFTIITVRAGIKMAMEHGHTILMIVQRNTIKLFKTHADLT
jgi:hypothetical protein